ncbi:unnamed protein product [Brassica oleracea var. botrytis]
MEVSQSHKMQALKRSAWRKRRLGDAASYHHGHRSSLPESQTIKPDWSRNTSP